MLEEIEASEPQPTNITRAVENVPKLLRECNAYACEQPKALPMVSVAREIIYASTCV